MRDSRTSSGGGTLSLSLGSCGFICFIVFLILKLAKVIDWNWFWIFFPLWLPIAITILIYAIIILVVFILEKRNH